MKHFREALAQAQQLARDRQRTNPSDGEALFALTLAAGMESDALSILEKKHLEGFGTKIVPRIERAISG